MRHPITPNLLRTMLSAKPPGIKPLTLRTLADAKRLRQVGLLDVDASGAYVLTEAGEAHLRASSLEPSRAVNAISGDCAASA